MQTPITWPHARQWFQRPHAASSTALRYCRARTKVHMNSFSAMLTKPQSSMHADAELLAPKGKARSLMPAALPCC